MSSPTLKYLAIYPKQNSIYDTVKYKLALVWGRDRSTVHYVEQNITCVRFCGWKSEAWFDAQGCDVDPVIVRVQS